MPVLAIASSSRGLAPCRARSDDLGAGPDPGSVLRRLADEPGLACLWGSWLSSATEVLIMSGPRSVSCDPAVLDVAPRTTGSDRDVVGGGWVGWLGYDVPSHLAYYDHLLRWRADTGRWSFEALWTRRRTAALRARREQLRAVLAEPVPIDRPDWHLGSFAGPDRARHLAAVEEAIGLIRAGEIYQANVCTRISATLSGPLAPIFAHLASTLAPRFGAFIDSGERAVLSLSPELFLRRLGDEVISSPIKGTWARNADDPDDDGAARLRASTKDVAENIMIVDLVRNDLGRVCLPGTVRVRELLHVTPHPGVWHLVSTVEGRLRPSVENAELVAATFAPGSVTGTPKVRAMTAISTLEDGPRGVYTGAIGIASPIAGLALSVAIRTFEVNGGAISLGVGGGITADSVPELEWRECAQKAVPLLRALGAPAQFGPVAGVPEPWQLDGGLIETLLAVDGEVLRLADHLARLERSARELYGFGVPGELADRVRAAAAALSGRVAVRIVLAPSGEAEVVAAAAQPRPSATDVSVAVRAGVWRHKWADRSWTPAIETLFVDESGSVLETTRGNVFVLRDDGTLLTPPLRDDLLPGVTRRAVLDLARDRGWPAQLVAFDVAALGEAAAVFWTSSLSGLVPITSVDGRALSGNKVGRARLAEIAAALFPTV